MLQSTTKIVSIGFTLVQLVIIVTNPTALCRYITKQSLTMKRCLPYYHDSHNPTRISCECSVDHCDNLVFDWPESQQFLKIVSSESGHRYSLYNSPIEKVALPPHSSITDYLRDDRDGQESNAHTITLDYSRQYQAVLGWGGTFTDASLININKLPQKLSKVLVENYYGADGLQYNFGRVPIAGTDFSNHTYTYNDVQVQDYKQEFWRLTDEDTKLKIPYIKMAKQLVAERNDNLKLFASSWSPPPWMKTNRKFVRGFLRGPSSVRGKTYKAYAKYLLNFLQAYGKNGLSMWGMTVQNEPGSAFVPFYSFNSLQFSPAEQIDFINYHLGPLLHQHGYNKSNFKLIIGDDSVGIVNILIDKILSDVSVRKYVSGLGIHWYLSGPMSYSYIDKLYESHKDEIEFILMTEACTGSMPYEHNVVLGDWSRGVSYAKDIIEDLNRNVNGWIDWNLALDLKGGPNWAGNYADSPIIVDYSNQKFYKNPMYYVLGHFTRFIPPGSKRIQLNMVKRNKSMTIHEAHYKLNESQDSSIMATAFILPSKKHVSLILLNLSDSFKQVRVKVIGNIGDPSTSPLSVELDPHSITSLVQGI